MLIGSIWRFSFLIIIIMLNENKRADADVFEYQLISDLLQNYSKIPRPSLNHEVPTQVSLTLQLRQILDVDVKNQILTIYAWIVSVMPQNKFNSMSLLHLFTNYCSFKQWNDPMLSWDPNKYKNITEIRVPVDMLWKPDLILENAVDKVDLIEDNAYLRVESSGSVSWFPGVLMRTYCALSARYFPFDKQNCTLVFMSGSFLAYQMDLQINAQSLLVFYKNNTEFDLVELGVYRHHSSSPFPTVNITFYIYFERKPLYNLLKMVLPCAITVVVAFLAFLVPNESGEKMSISITSLLSIVVLLLVISDSLPPSSDYVPLIEIFYATATALIALISLASVLSLNLHHYGEQEKPVPNQIQKVFFSFFGKTLIFPKRLDLDIIRTLETKEYADASVVTESNDDKLKENKTGCLYCLNKLRFSTRKIKVSPQKIRAQKSEIEKEYKEICRLQWSILADMVDRLFFYIFFIASLCAFSIIMASAQYSSLS